MPNTPALALPYPAPSDVPDVPYWLQQLAEKVETYLAGTYAAARGSTGGPAQTIPHNTYTAVTLGTPVGTPRGITVSAAGAMTITKAGLYRVTGAVAFTGNATGWRYAAIGVNGTTPSLVGSAPAIATPGQTIPNVTGPLQLAVGDVVQLLAYQQSGGGSTTTGTLDLCTLSLQRVGA